MPGTHEKAIEPEKRVLFRKASDYCALQDRCITEMSLKLRQWGADKSTAKEILTFLLKENFIDEQRFAVSFCRGKFRNLQWGRVKIRYELQMRKISAPFISKALFSIEEHEYLDCLQELAKKKMKTLGSNSPENRLKTMRFLAGKGFEPELIRNLFN